MFVEWCRIVAIYNEIIVLYNPIIIMRGVNTMRYKEIISPKAEICCEIIEKTAVFEGESVTQFGVKVLLLLGEVVVSSCNIPDISDDLDFVSFIAKDISDKRIPPSEALSFVEESLPK